MPTVTVKITDVKGREIQKTMTVEDNQIVRCAVCRGAIFNVGQQIYKISRLLAGTPNDIYVFPQVKYCVKCGTELAKDAKAEWEEPRLAAALPTRIDD